MSQPAVTDATSSSDAELHEAVRHFLPHEPSTLQFTRAAGGVNNKCYFVATPDGGPQYLLRIYNNGGNSARVAYEHAVLRLLKDKKFSFELPVPLPTRADADGNGNATSALLSSGASACLFPRIKGGPADPSSKEHARAIGRATAEVVAGTVDLHVPLPLPNPLYRNMYDVHHAITRESFQQLVRGPQCDHVRAAATGLLQELESTEQLIKRILAMSPSLPEQQIHADLHQSNVLIHEGAVSAVLDWEFSARDWRVMELVVGLSKFIATSGAEELFEAWVTGYGEAGGELTKEEALLAPELIVVRVLNNVIYFAGRAVAGEDDLAALTSRMDMYLARCKWIRERLPWMQQVLTRTLVPVESPPSASPAFAGAVAPAPTPAGAAGGGSAELNRDRWRRLRDAPLVSVSSRVDLLFPGEHLVYLSKKREAEEDDHESAETDSWREQHVLVVAAGESAAEVEVVYLAGGNYKDAEKRAEQQQRLERNPRANRPAGVFHESLEAWLHGRALEDVRIVDSLPLEPVQAGLEARQRAVSLAMELYDMNPFAFTDRLLCDGEHFVNYCRHKLWKSRASDCLVAQLTGVAEVAAPDAYASINTPPDQLPEKGAQYILALRASQGDRSKLVSLGDTFKVQDFLVPELLEFMDQLEKDSDEMQLILEMMNSFVDCADEALANIKVRMTNSEQAQTQA